MPFTQAHQDNLTAAVAAVVATKVQHEAARVHMDEQLATLSEGLAEGDIRVLGAGVQAVTKKDGVVKLVVVPGLLDPDAAVSQ